MTKLHLTAILNLKIASVVVVLVVTIVTYNHFLYWHITDDKSIQRLIAITDYLAQKKPPTLFSEVATQPNATTALNREHVLTLNKQLQPFVNNMFIPVNTVKFGFYSIKYESIVAIGPTSNSNMLIGIAPAQLNSIHASSTGQLIQDKKSPLWPGANTITYVKPLIEDGIFVGYAFACRNQDAIVATVWKRTMNIFWSAFLMLLLCIWVFRDLFIKLKEHLHLFGESLLTSHATHYNCEIPEFNPILNYISKQTQEMIHLDRLNVIGEMATGIAHEIRNPMTTVRGLLQFMYSKEEFSTQKSNFTLMINELDRANNIITEFLSLAQNNSMVFKENNLNTLIQDLCPLLQADALGKNSTLLLSLTTIPNLLIDSNSIRQLLLNLVRNGLDAMPTGGIIQIHTISTSTSVQLSISDTGIGIPPAILDKLGTPFFTTKTDGTGLGLAICYRIVQCHGGLIRIESEVNKGTTFIIEFKIPPLTPNLKPVDNAPIISSPIGTCLI